MKLTQYMRKKIKAYASSSLYRMNAGTADCYAFDLINDGKDWIGGYDWSRNLVDKTAEWLLMLDSGKFVKV